MRLAELVVADKAELDDLRVQSKWLWSGWAVAGLIAVLAGVVVAETIHMTHEVAKTQADQRELVQKMAGVALNQEATYRTQHAEAGLLISWGQFIKDRDDMVKYNHENAPSEALLTKATRHSTKVDP